MTVDVKRLLIACDKAGVTLKQALIIIEALETLTEQSSVKRQKQPKPDKLALWTVLVTLMRRGYPVSKMAKILGHHRKLFAYWNNKLPADLTLTDDLIDKALTILRDKYSAPADFIGEIKSYLSQQIGTDTAKDFLRRLFGENLRYNETCES